VFPTCRLFWPHSTNIKHQAMARGRKPKPAAAVATRKAPHRVSKHVATKSSGRRTKKPAASAASAAPTPIAPPPTAPRLTKAINETAPDFIVRGDNDKALFSLTLYRGEGMCLLAMNWKEGTPPDDFVGFGIDYQEPGDTKFYPIPNRIAFADAGGKLNPNVLSSRLSPFQKFRWVHFPQRAGIAGTFAYQVTPVFMDANGILSYGDMQAAGIELVAETYPGELNVCFTRGFISSQAFVNEFEADGGVGAILPATAAKSLDFTPTDPQEEAALAWMGFEARSVILGALDAAVADETAQVRIAAYDFNDSEIVTRLQKLGDRLRIIIDDSGSHKPPTAPESKAAALLAQSAGAANVQRQHMGDLQHNKTLVIDGDAIKLAVGGSTNFSWRGIYVQNNNAVALQGANAVKIFSDAFDDLWDNAGKVSGFNKTASADWIDLDFPNVDVKVTFSPHSASNAKLQEMADDIGSAESSLFYSLAFLYETKGVIRNAIEAVTAEPNVFVYGLSDKTVGGLNLQLPNGNPPVAFPAALVEQTLPPPFAAEDTGGSGTRLHHKFAVIDFNTPSARVYTGSHNFSTAADTKNAENLFQITDQRVATSYMIEAVAMFDHYEFRDVQNKSDQGVQPLELQKPPAEGSGDKPWWDKYWSVLERQRDRELFGK
jgi:PLD-like domain